jgi:hypothetical protein
MKGIRPWKTFNFSLIEEGNKFGLGVIFVEKLTNQSAMTTRLRMCKIQRIQKSDQFQSNAIQTPEVADSYRTYPFRGNSSLFALQCRQCG